MKQKRQWWLMAIVAWATSMMCACGMRTNGEQSNDREAFKRELKAFAVRQDSLWKLQSARFDEDPSIYFDTFKTLKEVMSMQKNLQELTDKYTPLLWPDGQKVGILLDVMEEDDVDKTLKMVLKTASPEMKRITNETLEQMKPINVDSLVNNEQLTPLEQLTLVYLSFAINNQKGLPDD